MSKLIRDNNLVLNLDEILYAKLSQDEECFVVEIKFKNSSFCDLDIYYDTYKEAKRLLKNLERSK